MSSLKSGDQFPNGVVFKFVPPNSDPITTCGTPVDFDATKELKNKKVVLVSVPGAFTPTCQQQHIVGYLEKLEDLKKKGLDLLVVIAYNDHWVMDAWRKANKVTDDKVLFMSDPSSSFSKSIGWTLGERTARYAIVIDNGKVVYAEKDDGELDKSAVGAALAHL